MSKIYTSATKLVLLMMVIGLLAFTYLGKVDNETFKTAMLMVLAFYFGTRNPTPAI